MASLDAGNAVHGAVKEAGKFAVGFTTGGYKLSTPEALTLLTLSSGVAGGLMNVFAAKRLGKIRGRVDANQMFWAVVVSFAATFAAGAVLTPTSASDVPVGV